MSTGDKGDESIDVELKIECSTKHAKKLIRVLRPDNDTSISMQVQGNMLVINISKLKATSVYNVLDDILRNYEVYREIDEKTEQ